MKKKQLKEKYEKRELKMQEEPERKKRGKLLKQKQE